MSNLLKTQYEFLFVGKDEGSFVENYAYDLGEGGEGSGKIFINLEISQNSIDAEKIGEIIFDCMRKIFFADNEVDAYERFEEALKETNKALNEYKAERENDWLGKLNIIIAAVVNEQLYLTQAGEAEAYLVRKRFVTTISDDLTEAEGKDMFTNIASGELEQGDFILFSTTRLLRYVSKTDLAKHIGSNLQASIMAIKDFLQGEVMSRIGLVAVQANGLKTSGMSKEKPAPASEENLPFIAHEKEEAYYEANISTNSVENKKVAVGLPLEKIKSVFNSSVSKFKNKFEQISRGEMRRGSNGNQWSFSNWGRNQILVAIIALILLLTLGVWWLRAKADEDQKIKALSSSLVQIRTEIDSAISNAVLDKTRASEMLHDAENKAILVLNSGYNKDKARELLDLILETRDKLDGVIHPKVQLMADLSKKRLNVSALGLVHLKDKLYAYEYNALYPITLDKVADPLTIDDNEKVISATNYDDKNSILFLTESGKIIEFKDDRMAFLQTDDGAFKPGQDITAYNTKIYILDTVNNKIWRYNRNRDKFNSAQDYVVGADLKNGLDMAIDGNVYVLNSDGAITKLFQGSKEDFVIKKGPVKALKSPTKIYTTADINQIYVLEANEHRVLAFNKDDRSGGAVYDKQYVFDDLKDIVDFYVDGNTGTMYVLTKTGVYRVIL